MDDGSQNALGEVGVISDAISNGGFNRISKKEDYKTVLNEHFVRRWQITLFWIKITSKFFMVWPMGER